MKFIRTLEVGCLDGEFYHDTKEYLEKRGVKWKAERGKEGELLRVLLLFPEGTKYRDINTNLYNRKTIELQGGGILYWSLHKEHGVNCICVPYMMLGGKPG